MPDLVALDLPAGDAFVTALRAAWNDGDAVFPVDQRLPQPSRDALTAEIAPTRVVTSMGTRTVQGRPVEEGDALVVATSGTSGKPRGVVLTHAALAASAAAIGDRLAISTENDQWLSCLPLAHMGGLGVVARSLITGTPLEVHAGFDPSRVNAFGRRGATLLSLVARQLPQVDAALFRLILLGGGAAPAAVPANVVVTYGLTEAAGGVVYDGTPLEGTEVRITGGEIELRGPTLLRAYRDGSDPKSADGWLATGDLGSIDRGVLKVHGRRGDLIISGGENVWPQPVEDCLAHHPAIGDVAVVGRPHPEWGEEVTAVVVPEGEPPTLEELRDLVKESLPAFMAPRSLELAEHLPRTSLGKLQRTLL